MDIEGCVALPVSVLSNGHSLTAAGKTAPSPGLPMLAFDRFPPAIRNQLEKAFPRPQAALLIDDNGSLYYQLAQACRISGQRDLDREMLKKF